MYLVCFSVVVTWAISVFLKKEALPFCFILIEGEPLASSYSARGDCVLSSDMQYLIVWAELP
jgi:hypothetical protein